MVQEQIKMSGTHKQKRGRSPSYPAISLDVAIERVRVLYNAVRRNWVNVDTALSYWGYKPKSGAGLVLIAALKKFGLGADQGSGDQRQVQITESAFRILIDDRESSAERDALIREAALKPTIHSELWEYYQGSLPADQHLRIHLIGNKAFTENGADEFIPEFRRTIEFARLGETGIISGDQVDKMNSPEERTMPDAPVKEREEADRIKDDDQPTPAGVRIYRWGLSGDREAEVRIPGSLTKDDIEVLEAYLSVAKRTLK